MIVMPQSFATSKHSCSDFDNLEMDVGTNVLMIMHVNDISRLSFGISDNHKYYSFMSATANTLGEVATNVVTRLSQMQYTPLWTHI